MTVLRPLRALLLALLAAPAVLLGGNATAIPIDNDVPQALVGHWLVDVLSAGDSRLANLTANRFQAGDVFTEDVLFDYFSYVDPGIDGVGLRLASFGAPPALTGDDEVQSSGAFVGVNGIINWTATSSIPFEDSTMSTTFTFTAETGTLGPLRFYRYMDEDVEGSSDDVFLARGSLANLNLELLTIDNIQVYGVSHSGALAPGQGLVNATFAGWAASTFNRIKPVIEGAGQPVDPNGIIDPSLPSFTHPVVGAAFGPRDIVSVLAWDVDPAASTATIVTTLGGVPDPPEASDAFPPECTGTLVEGSFEGSATDDQTEDANGNGILDPGEDTNGNFALDVDTGIATVELAPGAVNLSLSTDFLPGAPMVSIFVDVIDGAIPAVGEVVATDGADPANRCSLQVELGSFDPFGGATITESRTVTLSIGQPAAGTTGVQCVESDDAMPADADFNSAASQSFSDSVASFDFTLSPGNGVKTVCCRFEDGASSPALCDTIVLGAPLCPLGTNPYGNGTGPAIVVYHGENAPDPLDPAKGDFGCGNFFALLDPGPNPDIGIFVTAGNDSTTSPLAACRPPDSAAGEGNYGDELCGVDVIIEVARGDGELTRFEPSSALIDRIVTFPPSSTDFPPGTTSMRLVLLSAAAPLGAPDFFHYLGDLDVFVNPEGDGQVEVKAKSGVGAEEMDGGVGGVRASLTPEPAARLTIAVPEPGAMLQLGSALLGLAALVALRRRFRG